MGDDMKDGNKQHLKPPAYGGRAGAIMVKIDADVLDDLEALVSAYDWDDIWGEALERHDRMEEWVAELRRRMG